VRCFTGPQIHDAQQIDDVERNELEGFNGLAHFVFKSKSSHDAKCAAPAGGVSKSLEVGDVGRLQDELLHLGRDGHAAPSHPSTSPMRCRRREPVRTLSISICRCGVGAKKAEHDSLKRHA
jgi:hypothetical protein